MCVAMCPRRLQRRVLEQAGRLLPRERPAAGGTWSGFYLFGVVLPLVPQQPQQLRSRLQAHGRRYSALDTGVLPSAGTCASCTHMGQHCVSCPLMGVAIVRRIVTGLRSLRISRSVGLLFLLMLVQWIGQHVSDALTGPTTVEMFLAVARWNTLILFAACFIVGLGVQRMETNRWSEWAVASLVWLWLGRLGNPDVPGTAVFAWSYASTPAMVAGLGAAMLVFRNRRET